MFCGSLCDIDGDDEKSKVVSQQPLRMHTVRSMYTNNKSSLKSPRSSSTSSPRRLLPAIPSSVNKKQPLQESKFSRFESNQGSRVSFSTESVDKTKTVTQVINNQIVTSELLSKKQDPPNYIHNSKLQPLPTSSTDGHSSDYKNDTGEIVQKSNWKNSVNLIQEKNNHKQNSSKTPFQKSVTKDNTDQEQNEIVEFATEEWNSKNSYNLKENTYHQEPNSSRIYQKTVVEINDTGKNETVSKNTNSENFTERTVKVKLASIKHQSESFESTTSPQFRKNSSIETNSSTSHKPKPSHLTRGYLANYKAIANAIPIRSSSDSDNSSLLFAPKPTFPRVHSYRRTSPTRNQFSRHWTSTRQSPPPSPAPEKKRLTRAYSIRSDQESCNFSRRGFYGESLSNTDNESDNFDITNRRVSYDSHFGKLGVSPTEFKAYNRPYRSTNNANNDRISPMGRMERNPIEDHERKVIIEFCHLLEKSKQLFNGLRELPQYGHKQWHSYFGRTFDVYTKLWKFQQQHRIVLDNKYGLKRWQIGEIASKIGQLYYHFYLRTSETAYLSEAFSFYHAIRGRCYYTKACKEDKCELMVKKLRYYARFIVVCLLLKKIKLVRDLIKELDRQIVEYGSNYDPDDQIEWTVVVDEVKSFIQAEPVVTVIHPDNYPVILTHRLTPLTTPPVEKSAQMNLSLQEVLIVGSSSQQVKFSELTMDMFRMLQTLEREPPIEVQHSYDDSPRPRFLTTHNPTSKDKGYKLENGPRRDNPHKYLLFKPSPSQVLVYLASGCNDLPPNGALLLYVSADGQIVQGSKHPEDVGYDIGGLITTSKNDIHRDCSKEQKIPPPPPKYKELQCLHPGDLYPFTRRPLFIVIDSDNSYIFQHIPRHFGQPLVILMSPLELPTTFQDRKQQGSLFTLFLHSPLTAFGYCCDIHNISLVHWERAQIYVDTFMAEASQAIVRNRTDLMYIAFMGDDFLRLLLLRFIFCEVTLRMHRAFRGRTHLTRCSPPLPEELFEHPTLIHIILDLATHLQIRSHFNDPTAATGPLQSKE